MTLANSLSVVSKLRKYSNTHRHTHTRVFTHYSGIIQIWLIQVGPVPKKVMQRCSLAVFRFFAIYEQWQLTVRVRVSTDCGSYSYIPNTRKVYFTTAKITTLKCNTTKSKLLGIVVAELLQAGCPYCHPTNSVKSQKDTEQIQKSTSAKTSGVTWRIKRTSYNLPATHVSLNNTRIRISPTMPISSKNCHQNPFITFRRNCRKWLHLLKPSIALNGNPSQSHGASCHTGSHSVTCHLTQVNAPHRNPSQPGQYSIYLPWRDGRLSKPRQFDSGPTGNQTHYRLIASQMP